MAPRSTSVLSCPLILLFLLCSTVVAAQSEDAAGARTVFSLEFGRFDYTWEPTSNRLSEIETQGSSRYHFAAGAERKIIDRLELRLGVFYAAYDSEGQIYKSDEKYRNISEPVTLRTYVKEYFIGPELGVAYNFPLPFMSSSAYLQTGFRYGILYAGRAAGLIAYDINCNYLSNGDVGSCQLQTNVFDSDEPNNGFTSFTDPGNSFSLYGGAGLEIGNGKFRPFLELRTYLGQLGVMTQAYAYNEYGVVGGMKF